MESNNKSINRELPLFPSTADTSIPTTRGGSPQEPRQQLTIFYNGRICVSDVTELRARAIIMAASREMEEGKRTPTASNPLSPSMQSKLCTPSGVSMKRSLHRFLQKRKNRMEAMSPYNH